MPTVYICIGSNIERERYIHIGLQGLRKKFGRLWLSSVYDSAAVGFEGKPFLNLVAAFETSMRPRQVKDYLNRIEKANGETSRISRSRPRILDLDLILFGNYVSREPGFNIPHHGITQYAFMLEPLAEIAADLYHPVLKKTFSELWRDYAKDDIRQKRVRLRWGSSFIMP